MTNKKKPTDGYKMPPTPLAHVTGVIDPEVQRNYQEFFDLRDQNRITPVEDQGNRDDCWLYATTASLESTVMPEEQVDYSEYQLNEADDSDIPVGGGGNYYMAAAILARWAGPVSESTFKSVKEDTTGKKQMKAHRLVQQVMFLPNRDGPLDNDTIKFFLSRYGAIYADMHKELNYLNKETHAYYCPETLAANHAISVVGWDDEFPAERFNSKPPGNGAFIIKNSYGTAFGKAGFFYISYYDRGFRVGAIFNSAERTDQYIRNYQYDPLGHTMSTGFFDVVGWAANIFRAKDSEWLKAVAFYTNDANVSLEISIYTGIRGPDPTMGTKRATKQCGKIYPGYYTEILDEPVPLKKGESFSIVIRFENSVFIKPIPIEAPIQGHSSRARAERGQSYLSPDGSDWYDLTTLKPNANVCIKGFTGKSEENNK